MTSIAPQRYSSAIIVLHWIGALLVIGLLIVGSLLEDMTGASKMQLLTYHYYAGLATGALFLLRLVFFFFNARPDADPSWPKWQATASNVIEGLLYLLPLIMVATGMIAMSVYGLKSFVDNGDYEGYQAAHRIWPMLVHSLTANLLIAALGLHIVAALYHHFVKKDQIFNRITFRKGS
ncbi:cytochrome b/b6 domain-containing protein [uncultured Cohaesibacter sp.]|uniref:cytochrome b n=1 Tax=uncultured Cohaesibacter sp. TaxID=1002546 RepID=UPI002AA92358|nr:cytochrome b/b6 domain-containing protein [uncultured Cohaesibacter sp.]